MKYLPWVLVLISNASFSAGFDCEKATTYVEKTICSSQQLSSKDDQLYDFYERAKNDPNQKGVMIEIRKWLKNERNKCDTESCIEDAYDNFLPKIEESLNANDEMSNKNLVAGNSQDKRLDNNSNNTGNANFPWWLLMFGPLGVWIWNKFLRKKCPNCKSKSFNCINAQELDRWRQAVKVREKLSNGKSRERHVQKTYVKIERDDQCTKCNHLWSEITKEEK